MISYTLPVGGKYSMCMFCLFMMQEYATEESQQYKVCITGISNIVIYDCPNYYNIIIMIIINNNNDNGDNFLNRVLCVIRFAK